MWGKDEVGGDTWPYVRTEGGSVGFIPLASEGSLMKVIEIGDWDMDATTNLNVAHGLTLAKIRFVTIMIVDDLSSGQYDLAYGNAGSASGSFTLDATNVALNRVIGGFFDTAGFNATTFNRGWVTIWYTN